MASDVGLTDFLSAGARVRSWASAVEGSKDGDFERLNPSYRAQLAQLGLVVVHPHIKDLQLEA